MIKKFRLSKSLIFSGGGIALLGIAIVFISFIRQSEISSQPQWRGIIPGQTTIAEVVAILGEPKEIIECEEWGYRLKDRKPLSWYSFTPCLFAPLVYDYTEKGTYQIRQILFRGDKVWLIIVDTTDENPMPNEDLIAKYGWMEWQGWPIERHIHHLVFCQHGVIAAVDDEVVERMFYFEPLGPLDCQDEFGIYLKNTPGIISN